MSDLQLRQAERTGDPFTVLRAQIRADKFPKRAQHLLCALGYEPMVLIVGGPEKPNLNFHSYMRPGSFCSMKNAVWHTDVKWGCVAKRLMDRYWIYRIALDSLNSERPLRLVISYPINTLRAFVTQKLEHRSFRNGLIEAILKKFTQ